MAGAGALARSAAAAAQPPPRTPCLPTLPTLLGAPLRAAGTDESKLIRLLVSRRDQLAAVNLAYLKKYQKTLVSRVCEEFGGDLKAAFAAMLQGL